MNDVNGEMSAATEEDIDIVVGVGGAMVLVDLDGEMATTKIMR